MSAEKTASTSFLRCGKCNKLLAKGYIEVGEIELFCPRCKSRTILRAISPNTAPHDGLYGDRYACNQASSSS